MSSSGTHATPGRSRGCAFVLLASLCACASRGGADGSGGQQAARAAVGGNTAARGGQHAGTGASGSRASGQDASMLQDAALPSDAAPQRDDDAGLAAGNGAAGTSAGAGAAGSSAGPRTGLDAVLCDGAAGITFAAVMREGGNAFPGTSIMSENGYRFLIVEGTCRFWVQVGRLEHVVSGALTASDLQHLRDDFQLQRWQQLTGDYPQSGFDTPSYFYVFGRGKLANPCGAWGDVGGCLQVGSGNMVRENINWLQTAFQQNTDRLNGSGKPVTGDIRYLLVEGMSTIVEYQWSNPSSWPLGDPHAVAITQSVANQGYTPGTSRRATSADADALREVWRAFLSYEKTGREANMPASGSLAIPIVTAGTRYQLFIRDSIPLEDSMGLVAY